MTYISFEYVWYRLKNIISITASAIIGFKKKVVFGKKKIFKLIKSVCYKKNNYHLF